MPKRSISHIGSLLLLAVLILFSFSCKSTPKPAPEPAPVVEKPAPAPAPKESNVTQEMLNNLQAAQDKAAKARQDSIEVDGPVYFADEWKATENNYVNTGKNVDRGSRDSVNNAISSYNECAATFSDIAQRSLPLYAEAQLAKIEAARKEAVDAGANEYYAEFLGVADGKRDEVKKLFDAMDYQGTIAEAKNVIDYYSFLKLFADAYVVRSAIVDKDFVKYDSSNFDKADKAGLAGVDNYDKGDIGAALKNAQEAAKLYNQVWKTAWKSLATERKGAATKEQKNALDAKANVAVKEGYAEANGIFNQANKGFQSQKYEDAAELYSQSIPKFIAVTEEAIIKRKIADEAIQVADQKVAESEETAIAAEEILRGDAE